MDDNNELVIVLAGNRAEFEDFLRMNPHLRDKYIYAGSADRIRCIATPHVFFVGTYAEHKNYDEMMELINARRSRYGLPSI